LFDDLSTSPTVVSTNAGFAVLTVILIFLFAQIFNKTLEENDAEIRKIFRGVTSPFTSAWSAGAERVTLPAIAGPLAMIVLAALIYGFGSPDFGVNKQSVVLLLSYLGVFLAMTYVYEGGQALMARRFGFPATVKVFPFAVLICVICVVLTRVEGFQPGIIFGFVAGDALLAEAVLTKEQEGKRVLYPALVLMGMGVVAYLLAGPFRTLAEDTDFWLASVPEGLAVGLFIAALQGLFFEMIPIEFMDGHKLFRWNKLAWLGMASVTAFLFWHVFINGGAAADEAVQAGDTVAALILLGVCVGLTVLVYSFFWVRRRTAGPEPA
jgi:hypothetical protein